MNDICSICQNKHKGGEDHGKKRNSKLKYWANS